MSDEQFDLIVLGGGNAVTVGMDAGRAGWKVAVVEEGPLGGTCPNRGCIPSKLLIGYAERAQDIREAARFHLDARLDGIDGDALLRETFGATRKTDGKIEGALPDGVTLVRGRGRFVGPRTVRVGDRVLSANQVIVATGGRPRRPTNDDAPGVEDTPYWTSREVFEIDTLPRSIVIVGGGYIACEMAHFFNGVGVETTMIARGSELLRAEDRDVRAVFKAGFTDRVSTLFGTRLSGVKHDDSGFTIDVENADGGASLTADALLFAIGRVPNTDDIGAELAGIELTSNGFVSVDDHLRTSAEGVYSLGDVNGRHAFTHTAAWEAMYLSRVLLESESGPVDYGPVPHAVFSLPEVAGVGRTEDELLRDGVEYLSAALPYTSAARGRAVKEEHGLCKFLVAPDGEILGCHLVGFQASTLLHEVIPVMRWRNQIESLTDMIHVHPALSEVVRNTARKARDAVKKARAT